VSAAGPRHGVGTVCAFDAEAGLGEVRAADGAVLPFHCVAIADGSRSIEVGTEVAFVRAAALPGRWEAARLVPLGRPPQS